jgi:putative transposase
MPRRNRLNLTDAPQRVIQRGDNHQATFFAEEDYRFCLDYLVDAARKYGCQIGIRGKSTQAG